MTTVHVTYWRDIPVLVTARDEREEVSVPLSPAFQELGTGDWLCGGLLVQALRGLVQRTRRSR